MKRLEEEHLSIILLCFYFSASSPLVYEVDIFMLILTFDLIDQIQDLQWDVTNQRTCWTQVLMRERRERRRI